MKRTILLTVLTAFMALLLSCSKTENKTASDNSGTTPATETASTSGPTFSAPDLDGNMHSYSEYEGKGPLIINFWGTWCPPCRAELPDLKKIYADYKGKGVQLVSLAVKDTPEKVRSFSQQNGMDWVMLMSTEDALISFNVTVGIPTTIFIDKNGVEKGRLIGMSSYDEFKNQIDKIL